MSNVFRFLISLEITFLLLLNPSNSDLHLQFPCQHPLHNFNFCNPSLPIATRAESLVSILTMDEKIQQLSDNASEIPRLGIPAYQWWSESLHGVAKNGRGVDFRGPVKSATELSQVIVAAASFNRTLWREVAEAIAVEARAMHNLGQAGLTFWTPNINGFRDPRWGRGQETPGEDPMVTSAYAFEYVRGFQGLNPRLMLSACCKHFIAYDLENWGAFTRYDFNAVVTKQDMEDTYQPPFQTYVEKGKATCIMCSYNRVNGIPACADHDQLQKVRKDWGFKRYVTSDCDAVATIFRNHNFTKTPEDAVAIALKAGMDLNCGSFMKRYTKSAIDQGKVSEKDVDRALFNLFSVLIRLGRFDGNPGNNKFGSLGIRDVCSSQHRELALDAARQGMELLKNDHNFLPWNKDEVPSLAAIGPMANTSKIGGDYIGFACTPETILQAFQNHIKNTVYSSGCEEVACNSTVGIPEAVSIAKEAEYVILVLGLNLTQEAEKFDRYSLLLPGNQMALTKSIAAEAKKPLVLVLTGGGPIDVSFTKNDPQIASIIWIGYPGETGGKALSDIIFGDCNPGGRLPVTWYPESYVEKIPMTNMNMRPDPATGYPGRTYRFYARKTVYSFGDGLSYATYEHSLIQAPTIVSIPLEKGYICLSSTGESVNAAELLSCKNLGFSVKMRVKNKGKMRGSHAVMLFSSPPAAHNPPQKHLLDFRKLNLTPQEEGEVEFRVDVCEDLSVVDELGKRKVVFGVYVLQVGDLKHSLTLSIMS